MSHLLNLSLDQLQQFFIELIPHHRTLNLKVIECSVGHLSFELPYCESLIGNPSTGEVHEGAITTLIDSVCGSVVLTQLEELRRVATLDLRIDFLRKGQSGFSPRCEAECLRITNHVAFVRAVAYEQEVTEPLAIASGTFAIFAGKNSNRASNSERTAENDEENPWAFNDLKSIINAIPYAQKIGIDLSCKGENLVGRLAFSENLVGNPKIPALHGGILGSLLQITAKFQLMMTTRSTSMPRIFSCTTEYLLTPKPIDTFAVATIISQSRRFANIRVFGYQESPDQIIAAATVQLLIGD